MKLWVEIGTRGLMFSFEHLWKTGSLFKCPHNATSCIFFQGRHSLLLFMETHQNRSFCSFLPLFRSSFFPSDPFPSPMSVLNGTHSSELQVPAKTGGEEWQGSGRGQSEVGGWAAVCGPVQGREWGRGYLDTTRWPETNGLMLWMLENASSLAKHWK